MRRPDFFFVGHPRSGSGLLDSYLKGHPDIFMSRKELHHFGSDLRYEDPPRTRDNFLMHFKDAAAETRVGEASTWYLVSEKAAQDIHDFCPDAQILMMLRNPVSWLHSLHSHLVFSGDEEIEDFADALAAEPSRIDGSHPPPAWSRPWCATHYRSLVRYADQVNRYFEVFGRDRVMVLILDDFKDDSAGEYARVCRFLGVPETYEGIEEVLEGSQRSRNSNRRVYSRRLRSFVRRPENWRVMQGLEPAPFPGWGMTMRAVRRGNIKYLDRDKMDASLRAQLTRDFTPEVEKLEALLERDLSAWKATG